MAAAADEQASGWVEGARLDLDREMRGLTLRVLGRSLFGVDLDEHASDLGPSIQRVLSYVTSRGLRPVRAPKSLPTPARRRFRAALADIHAVIDEAIAGCEGDPDRAGELVRLLLAARDPDTGRPRKFAYAPGLVVVDGGPPQVAAAQRALDELGIDDIPVIGLAKRLEEVWVPGQDDPVILARTSEGLYLLQRVRDEAHRFAITHHRNRRSKSMVESVLDDVPGLGEVRRKVLMRHFGSLKKLRAASIDEIAALPGFGQRTATAISEALEKSRRTTAPAVNMTTGEILDDDDESVAAVPAGPTRTEH